MSRISKLVVFSLLSLFAVPAAIMADNDALMRFAGNIHQFNELFPQEKVYLQFDNTAYFQGETIWYKAFVTKASDMSRAPSKVLYVDLISPNGVVLEHQKLKIAAGQADGCFSLFDASTQQARELRGVIPYPSGYYEIRAYTQYMLNFDESILFSRVLPIYKTPEEDGDYADPDIAPMSKIESQNRPDVARLHNVNIQFYPEGGNTVRGLQSRVAFKATDALGHGLEGTLTLTCDDGLQVDAKSGHEGMGSFIFDAGNGRTKAVFTTGGKQYNVSIPAPLMAGYTMQVDNLSKNLDVTIRRSDSRHERSVGLTVTCRGELIMFKELSMKDGENRFSFDTDGWPVGVCRAVLFTDRGEVLAARSIFNEGKSGYVPPTLTVKSDKKRYKAFEQMKLSFDLRDRQGNPFRDRFCVSVRDASDYGTQYGDNLMTDMLLSSDLKGFIHNPSYYFESDDKEHRRNLDLLCMVQGWERYDWQYMTDNRVFQETHRMEENLSLNGWILSNNLGKGRNMKDVKIYVAVAPRANDNLEMGQAVTGVDGYFGFDMRDFYGKADLTMRIAKASNEDKEPKAKIRLERAQLPGLRAYTKEELQPAWARKNPVAETEEDSEFPTIVDETRGVALPEVDIEGKRKYVDYFTFQAYDVNKDTETELDMGNYTTDVTGYLIEKGYSVWCPSENATIWVEVTNTADGSRYGGAYDRLGVENMYYFNNAAALSGLDEGSNGSRATYEMVENNLVRDYFRLNGHNVVWYVHDDDHYYGGEYYSQPWNIDTQDIESILVFDNLLSMSQIIKYAPLYARYLDSSGNMAQYYDGNSDAPINMMVDVKLKPGRQIVSDKDKRNLGKRVTTLEGLALSHQFYAPEYPNGAIPGDVDYRRTLYWNPNVVTDEKGHAEIEFYNNSYSTRFNVSGAGITAGGSPYVLDENF